jgi:hypothetical protein
VTEIGMAIFIIGALLVVDRDRLAWLADKLRDAVDWMTS